jgi:uracil-DNA glycosylase family 4
MKTSPWRHRAGKAKALIIVGAYPGLEEDKQGEPMVGQMGRLVQRVFLEAMKFREVCNVYVTNAVRCLPRNANMVTQTHVKACKQWLVEDIERIAEQHEEVVVLAMGDKARTACVGTGTSLRRFPQGAKQKYGKVECRTWATKLPVVLLPDRDPAAIHGVLEHFMSVRSYLEAGHLLEKIEVPDARRLLMGPLPPKDVGVISLDVETYGAVGKQTVFHPEKMWRWDGVRPGRINKTVSLTWRDKRGELVSRVWDLTKPGQVKHFVGALKRVERLDVLGQNIQFDLLCLRAGIPELREVLRWDRCRLRELQVVNFLDNDQREEISLKNLSLVLGVTNYFDEVDLAKQQYPGVCNSLIEYNAKDTLATYVCWEVLRASTALKYGEDSNKLSSETVEWYSRLLWMLIDMSEQGIRYDLEKLGRVHDRYTRALAWMRKRAWARWKMKLEGKGSKGSKQGAMDEIIESVMPFGQKKRAFLKKIKFTEKTREYSVGKDNFRLLKGMVPLGTEERAKLIAMQRYAKFQKIVTSYTRPLLYPDIKKKADLNNALVGAYAYPSWHPVPSFDSDEDMGGRVVLGKDGWLGRTRPTLRNRQSFAIAFSHAFVVESSPRLMGRRWSCESPRWRRVIQRWLRIMRRDGVATWKLPSLWLDDRSVARARILSCITPGRRSIS